jgi:hypothetical protein
MSNKLDPTTIFTVEQRLEELKDVPARDPLRAASGRTRFLRQAAEYRQAVSLGKEVRQSRWTFPIRKEKLAMNALVSLILVASLLLGGGATVVAAQDDLPNQSLYQLKLWTENATLAMNGEPQEQATLLMTMAQTRVQEMAALAEMGIVPPDQVRERLEQHLRQTLQIAANVDDATCERILLQLRDRLQTHDRLMQQLQTQVSTETEPLLTQTREMLQTQLRLVDEGLADPQGFRYIMQNQMQYGQEEEIAPEPNQQGEPGFHKNGPAEPPVVEPGNGNGDGSGPGNEAPSGPNPDKPQDGNGGGGPGNEAPGGPNPDGPKDGSGSGSDGGSGPGGGGKN